MNYKIYYHFFLLEKKKAKAKCSSALMWSTQAMSLKLYGIFLQLVNQDKEVKKNSGINFSKKIIQRIKIVLKECGKQNDKRESMLNGYLCQCRRVSKKKKKKNPANLRECTFSYFHKSIVITCTSEQKYSM